MYVASALGRNGLTSTAAFYSQSWTTSSATYLPQIPSQPQAGSTWLCCNTASPKVGISVASICDTSPNTSGPPKQQSIAEAHACSPSTPEGHHPGTTSPVVTCVFDWCWQHRRGWLVVTCPTPRGGGFPGECLPGEPPFDQAGRVPPRSRETSRLPEPAYVAPDS